MKRSMAGYSGAPATKMARTVDHPLNPPTLPSSSMGPPPTNSNNSHVIAELRRLQVRNTELEGLNKEIYALLKDTMKQAKEDLAAVKADSNAKINAIRDHHAKLQGEIAALNRPRRRTTLRKEIEEFQEKVEGLETRLRDSDTQNTQLREAIIRAERERDELKLRFEAMGTSNGQTIGNAHPTPPLSQGSIISPNYVEQLDDVNFQQQQLNSFQQQLNGVDQQYLDNVDFQQTLNSDTQQQFDGAIQQQFNGVDQQQLNGADHQQFDGVDQQQFDDVDQQYLDNVDFQQTFNNIDTQQQLDGATQQQLNGVQQQLDGVFQQQFDGVDQQYLGGVDFQQTFNNIDPQQQQFDNVDFQQQLFNHIEQQPSYTSNQLKPSVAVASTAPQTQFNHSPEAASGNLPNAPIDQAPDGLDNQLEAYGKDEPLLWGDELPGLDFDAYIDIDALIGGN
ncbi:uncharacterized protein GGS25DRAFT_521269 [Hypoxylon fragiforme]|uniref:uncharacterized protein n=1 Tax=Hypoxylon fragiforme TaxID=63214 RepID=UPI0020C6B8FC|nr:uncharacterized protein GGS25DRAFT_521269 [Hypoxylon fragiforme]KAI2608102.1 hypothetical protein GGS25DRAFT_521269 [Hypoxylon fragiforme]